MFKISTRGQYALLIMTELAESDPERYVPLKLLSHRHNLSKKYLEQIFIQLSKSGLVVALRGNNGGYKLSRKPEEYTAGEILRVMEGDLVPASIFESNVVKDQGNQDFWTNFETAINSYVDSVTLDKIVAQNQNGEYLYTI